MLHDVIQVLALAKQFGRTPALRGLDLTVAAGEVVGLIGPNGAGKTTALRVMSGFLLPDSGRVMVAGVDVHKDPAGAAARMAYVPEAAGNCGALRVVEQLRYQARLCGLSRVDARSRVRQVLDEFSLGRVQHRLVGRLSRGYSQRVALATALLARPSVVLLDEPMTGLDPAQRQEFRRLLAANAANASVLFSSHMLTEVTAMCHRVVFVVDGVAVAQGTAQELCAATRRDTLEDAFATLMDIDGR